MYKPILLTLTLALGLGGCGYKKDIERLEDVIDQAEADLSDRDATIAELEATVADQDARIAQLQADLEEAEQRLADTTEALDAERDKVAGILADRGALRDEVDAMKDAMAELQDRKRRAEERIADFRALVDQFRSMIDAGTLEVKIIDGRMVVVLATDVLFDSGSAKLSDEGQEALAQVAQVLAGLPDRDFQVEGHTDDEPIATQRYPNNWYLAAARAIGVVEHMVDHGLDPKAVSAASYADNRPVASNEEAEGRAQNRRIEIVLLPDLSELPGYDQLEDL